MENLNNYKICILEVVNSQLFQFLIGFIIFDIITGVSGAFKEGVLNSNINKIGITKHLTITLFVLFFCSFFRSFKMEEFSKIMVYFYLGSYGLSIFENLSLLGIPIPKWMKDKFLLLKEDSNKGVNNGSKRIKDE